MVTFAKMKTFIPVAVLFMVNALNFMDRYTVAGVLNEIQSYYDIEDAQGGLIQAVFIGFYIFLSPITGYLGDRYNRKRIMTFGLTAWIIVVFASTLVPSNMFWLFLILRGLVSIGEATFWLTTPSIIGDLYSGSLRSKVLMFLFLASPVGSGLGYVVGSYSNTLIGGWQWGLRVTCVLGIVGLVLIVLFINEPERGGAEKKAGKIAADVETTNYWTDLKEIFKIKTYVLTSFGYSALICAVGVMSWWVPTMITRHEAYRRGWNSTEFLDDQVKANIAVVFGVVNLVSGLVGIVLGSTLSRWMREGAGPFRYIQTKRSDAIVSLLGTCLAIPTMLLGLWAVDDHLELCYVMIGLSITFIHMNWAIGVDMLLSVVTPPRRNTANALQVLISHIFGDGSGPFLFGRLSDAIRGKEGTVYEQFRSLQISLYISTIVLFIGAVLFAIASLTIIRDQRIFEEGSMNLKNLSDSNSISGEMKTEKKDTLGENYTNKQL